MRVQAVALVLSPVYLDSLEALLVLVRSIVHRDFAFVIAGSEKLCGVQRTYSRRNITTSEYK
jgi:hypothetical protein